MKENDVCRVLQQHGLPTNFANSVQRQNQPNLWALDFKEAYPERLPVWFFLASNEQTDRIQIHSHSFYELVYCLNSCDVIYLVGTERYSVQAGDLLCFHPNTCHHPIFPKKMDEPYTRVILRISAEFLYELYATFPDMRYKKSLPQALLRMSTNQRMLVDKLFKRGLSECKNRDPGWEMTVIGVVLQIATSIERAILDEETKWLPVVAPEMLDQVIAYLDTNLARKITIQDVADHFYVSSSTISHLFRDKMSISFYKYVTQRRLVTSKNLIFRGIPLEQISEAVGFSNYQTFFRAFKQAYGVSPSQFRKIARESKAKEF